jgi:sialate O-acetylesterase
MEWLLRDTDDAVVEMAKANFPKIRQLKINQDLSFDPKSDILSTEWEQANPQTAGNFTAVG